MKILRERACEGFFNLRKVPRVAILGVGHELRGDDAAGTIAARRLEALLSSRNDRLLVIDAGPAPENQTGRLRQFSPDLVVIVDAANLDSQPGLIRWLELTEITGFGASTHTLPLATLASFLASELACEVGLIGVQPAQTGICAPLSPPLEAAVDEIVHTLSQILIQGEYDA